jgi:hypothetical protein
MAQVSEDVAKLLRELEEEERAISLRRRRVHERIAFYPETAAEEHHQQERELSAKRRLLHARINALRGTSERLA